MYFLGLMSYWCIKLNVIFMISFNCFHIMLRFNLLSNNPFDPVFPSFIRGCIAVDLVSCRYNKTYINRLVPKVKTKHITYIYLNI